MAPGIPGFAKEVVWTVDWHGDIGTCSSCWRNFYSRMAFLRQPTLWDGVFLTRHHLNLAIYKINTIQYDNNIESKEPWLIIIIWRCVTVNNVNGWKCSIIYPYEFNHSDRRGHGLCGMQATPMTGLPPNPHNIILVYQRKTTTPRLICFSWSVGVGVGVGHAECGSLVMQDPFLSLEGHPILSRSRWVQICRSHGLPLGCEAIGPCWQHTETENSCQTRIDLDSTND